MLSRQHHEPMISLSKLDIQYVQSSKNNSTGMSRLRERIVSRSKLGGRIEKLEVTNDVTCGLPGADFPQSNHLLRCTTFSSSNRNHFKPWVGGGRQIQQRLLSQSPLLHNQYKHRRQCHQHLEKRLRSPHQTAISRHCSLPSRSPRRQQPLQTQHHSLQ